VYKAVFYPDSSFDFVFLSRGIVNTFGAFQTYYEGTLSSTPSAISWIGSIQGCLLLIIGVLTGPIFDMGFFRTLLAVGSFLTVFGMMMTSISTEYYQIFLAQGVCVGLGSGCLFIPSVAIVATYFSKKRSFAVGLAASGSSLGRNLIIFIFAVFHNHSARRRHLPRRVSPITAKDWLWLGDPCNCFHNARHPWHLPSHHEMPSYSFSKAKITRHAGVERNSLHTVHRRRVSRFPRSLYSLLLRQLVCPKEDECKRGTRILLRSSPKHSLIVRANHSQPPCRQNGTTEHAHSMFSHLCHPLPLLDRN